MFLVSRRHITRRSGFDIRSLILDLKSLERGQANRKLDDIALEIHAALQSHFSDYHRNRCEIFIRILKIFGRSIRFGNEKRNDDRNKTFAKCPFFFFRLFSHDDLYCCENSLHCQWLFPVLFSQSFSIVSLRKFWLSMDIFVERTFSIAVDIRFAMVSTCCYV